MEVGRRQPIPYYWTDVQKRVRVAWPAVWSLLTLERRDVICDLNWKFELV